MDQCPKTLCMIPKAARTECYIEEAAVRADAVTRGPFIHFNEAEYDLKIV